MAVIICPGCHDEVDDRAKFCSSCGSNTNKRFIHIRPPPKRERSIIGIIFIGAFILAGLLFAKSIIVSVEEERNFDNSRQDLRNRTSATSHLPAITAKDRFNLQRNDMIPKLLSVQNTGNRATTIRKIVVNDRDACSPPDTEAPWTDADLKYWLAHRTHPGSPVPGDVGLPLVRYISPLPITLEVGEAHLFSSQCNVIRATIITDEGSTAYTFD